MISSRVYSASRSPLFVHAIAVGEVDALSPELLELRWYVVTTSRDSVLFAGKTRVPRSLLEGEPVEAAHKFAREQAQGILLHEIIYPLQDKLNIPTYIPSAELIPSQRDQFVALNFSTAGRNNLARLLELVRDPALSVYLKFISSLVVEAIP